VSKSDDAMLTPSAAEPRTLDRRDFLTKLAAGAVLAPLAKAGVVASGMPDPQLRAPSNLRVVSTGTLTSSARRPEVGASLGLIAGIGLLLIWRSGPRAPQRRTARAGWMMRRNELIRQAGIESVSSVQLLGLQAFAIA